jgi:hypothetical protein
VHLPAEARECLFAWYDARSEDAMERMRREWAALEHLVASGQIPLDGTADHTLVEFAAEPRRKHERRQ